MDDNNKSEGGSKFWRPDDEIELDIDKDGNMSAEITFGGDNPLHAARRCDYFIKKVAESGLGVLDE
jgi:hypothetical protein